MIARFFINYSARHNKPTPWNTDGTDGHPLNNSYIGVTCQIVEYRTRDTPTYYELAGIKVSWSSASWDC